MVLWHLHVESAAGIPQVLGGEDGALLANEKGSAIGVATDIVGADRQVSDLEALDTVDVETLVQDTMCDNIVAILGAHGAGAQGVPGLVRKSQLRDKTYTYELQYHLPFRRDA